MISTTTKDELRPDLTWDDVYPPLAELYTEMMSDPQQAALSNWEKDLICDEPKAQEKEMGLHRTEHDNTRQRKGRCHVHDEGKTRQSIGSRGSEVSFSLEGT
jgi:hypothetical protein